jgi:DNA-directed RNA polymerase specialized sigma24 family protein
MLGIPVGTLKWRVNEARRRIKARLVEVGYGQGLGARG